MVCRLAAATGLDVYCYFGEHAIARRFRPQPKDTGKRLRINDQIRTSPVRLIGLDNEQLGVVDIDRAAQLAQDADLDLVEVSPNSDPPVCRVMDYGKWKYAQRKKEQKAKSNSKQSELKGIRLRPKIDVHDLDIKVNRAQSFLDEGHKVQFTMLFRGREMAHQELGIRCMNKISATLESVSKIEMSAKMQGRRMTMLLSPDRSGKQAHTAASTPASTTASAPASTEA